MADDEREDDAELAIPDEALPEEDLGDEDEESEVGTGLNEFGDPIEE